MDIDIEVLKASNKRRCSLVKHETKDIEICVKD